LDTNEIFYFESVDKKTFIYMDKEVFQTHLRLYELEERLKNTDFFRASKSTIINLRKVKNIVPMFGGRIEILLDNDEKLVVSRQYVPILKNKLDL
ncbi:MAG TPA: histidine kinase, partial [Clostridium sp.]|nr:histidine kinase [Clostridium sp.]